VISKTTNNCGAAVMDGANLFYTWSSPYIFYI